MNTKVGDKRLLELAAFLRTIPERQFDLWDFAGSTSGLLLDGLKRRMSLDCNTTACAIGWATALWPKQFWFSKEGYMKTADGEDDYGELFFAVSDDQWEMLFSPGVKRTAKQEAAFIERFVKERS